MLTLPTPVAAVLGACHLLIAVTMMVTGAHWLAAFLIAAICDRRAVPSPRNTGGALWRLALNPTDVRTAAR